MSHQSSFLAAAKQLHPALVPEQKCSMAANSEIAVVNKKNLENLYSELSRAFPTAGKVYWINRCWALLYWQPIYLSVLAVHECKSILESQQLQSLIRNQSIYGFLPLEDSAIQPALSHSSLITQQAKHLQTKLEQDFDLLSSIGRIAKGNAWGLIADCILMVLKKLPSLTQQQRLLYADQWLSALQLFDPQGKPLSELVIYPDAESLLLNRKSCCMHYLRDKNDLCISCPKQPDPIRWQRLKQQAKAHFDAA